MTASLAAVTVTPGNAAPLPSVMSPRSDPVSTPCAVAATAETRTRVIASPKFVRALTSSSFRHWGPAAMKNKRECRRSTPQ
jgi:hypothetical protein